MSYRTGQANGSCSPIRRRPILPSAAKSGSPTAFLTGRGCTLFMSACANAMPIVNSEDRRCSTSGRGGSAKMLKWQGRPRSILASSATSTSCRRPTAWRMTAGGRMSARSVSAFRAPIIERRRTFRAMGLWSPGPVHGSTRSEEHTSELQSRFDLVCRLLLEKKNTSVSHLEHHVGSEGRHTAAPRCRNFACLHVGGADHEPSSLRHVVAVIDVPVHDHLRAVV